MKLLPLLLLAGCATTITSEETEWRTGIDAENWRMCEYVYQRAGKPTLHRGHIHSHGHTNRWMIRDDLNDNGCRGVLKGYWIEY